MRSRFSYVLEFSILILILVGFVYANNVFLESNSEEFFVGDSVVVDIYFNTSDSDLYALQFDLNYDLGVLEFENIVEGDFLSSDNETTIFNYSGLSGGIIDSIYVARNTTNSSLNPGINGTGVVARVTFKAISIGSANLNVSDVIWVNSTIENDSVNQAQFNVSDFVVVVSSSSSSSSSSTSTSSSSSTSSSGSSGGSSGGSTYIPPVENESQNESEENEAPVDLEVEQNPDENILPESNTTLEDDFGENDSEGFLALTGRAIGDAFNSGGFFRSWVFFFILGLIVIFVVVVILRKKMEKPSGEWSDIFHEKFNK